MDRRQFLIASLLLPSCSTFIPTAKPAGKKGSVLLALRNSDDTSLIRILDLDTMDFKDYPLPIKDPHSVLMAPGNPNEFFIFETFGNAATLNILTGESRKFQSPKGTVFSGHGVLVPETKTLWCSEFDGTNTFIRERSMIDMSLTRNEFLGSHHLVKLPGTTLIACGGESYEPGKTYFNYFDFRKYEFVQKIKTDCLPAHFMALSETEVVGVSNKVNVQGLSNQMRKDAFEKGESASFHKQIDLSAPTPNFYTNTRGEYKSYWDPARKEIFKHGMGLTYTNKTDGIYIATYQDSNTLIVWKNFEIQKIISMAYPYAVVSIADGSSFLAFGRREIRMYSSSTYELEKLIPYDKDIHVILKYS